MFGIFDEREVKPLRITEARQSREGICYVAQVFFSGHPFVFIKLKDNQTVSCFSQTQQYVISFRLDDDMFLSLDQYQAIFTKLPVHRKKHWLLPWYIKTTVHIDINKTSIDTNKINTKLFLKSVCSGLDM